MLFSTTYTYPPIHHSTYTFLPNKPRQFNCDNQLIKSHIFCHHTFPCTGKNCISIRIHWIFQLSRKKKLVTNNTLIDISNTLQIQLKKLENNIVMTYSRPHVYHFVQLPFFLNSSYFTNNSKPSKFAKKNTSKIV